MPEAIVRRVRREYNVAKTAALLWRHGVRHGTRPYTAVGMAPAIRNDGDISIGDRIVFWGVESRSFLHTEAKGQLTIGHRVMINSGAIIRTADSISIGDDVKIGSLVSIADTDGHEIVPGAGIRVAPVVIGNDVWIGRGAIILPGVSVGDGAVVGAGSIVTRDVLAFSVVAGNPARLLRQLPRTTARRI
jgi:acetyltransferase-like isoleucine patch superfamily enzyme